eukprot:Skav214890  [mRNA]  locus=scaffold1561:22505:25152:+ [translate_table: standard]
MLSPDPVPKRASMSTLKVRIVTKWLRTARSLDLLKQVMEDAATAKSLSKSPAASSSSGHAHATGAAQPSSTIPPAAGKAKKSQKGESILEQCPLIEGEHGDETDNFTSVGQGPPLPDAEMADVPISQLLVEGTDGIVPVAALVKILQGLQELSNGIAVLYAETCRVLKNTEERRIVRRVVMGTAEQVGEVYHAEMMANLPKLRVWGILIDSNSTENTQELVDELDIQEIWLGKVNPREMPTDLSGANVVDMSKKSGECAKQLLHTKVNSLQIAEDNLKEKNLEREAKLQHQQDLAAHLKTQVSFSQEKCAYVRMFTSACYRHPKMHNQEPVTIQEILSTMETEELDHVRFVWLKGCVIAKIIGDAGGDVEPGASQAALFSAPLSMDKIVECVHFELKELVEEGKSLQEQFDKAQRKYNTMKESHDNAQSRKRKVAEKVVARLERKKELRGHLLARKNALNRAQKGVKTPRVTRPEEDLEEVGGFPGIGCRCCYASFQGQTLTT